MGLVILRSMAFPNISTNSRLKQFAKDKTLPIWLRACLWVGVVSLQLTFFGKQLSGVSRLSEAGNQLATVASGVLCVAVILVGLVLGLHELKRAGQATGQRGLVRQMLHILLRAFLFVLLPAMLITSLLITWGILTHQPAFR